MEGLSQVERRRLAGVLKSWRALIPETPELHETAALVYIAAHPNGRTVPELAARLDIESAAAAWIAQRLAKGGLVQGTPCTLTERGIATVREMLTHVPVWGDHKKAAKTPPK